MRSSSGSRAEAVDGAEEAQVLDHSEIEVERELLAHVAEPVLPALGVLRDVDAAEARDAAGGRRQQPREHADRRRLAGAVRAEEAEDAAARDVEADLVHGGEVAEPAGDVAHRDDGVAAHAAHAARPAASLRSTNTSSSDGAIGSTSTEPASRAGLSPELSPRPSPRRRMRRARQPPAPRCRRSCRGRAGRCRTATRRRRRRRSAAPVWRRRGSRSRPTRAPDRSATAARGACRRRRGVRRRGSRCARRTPLRPCTASTRRWSGRGGSARAASSRTRGATADRRRSSARRAAADRARSPAPPRARASASCRPTARRRGAPGTARGRPCRAGAWRGAPPRRAARCRDRCAAACSRRSTRS